MSQDLTPTTVSVLPPTLTKGTQGATGYSTQDLKDAGRVNIAWTVDGLVTAAATEGLLTVTESRDGAATSTFTTKVITSGKRLRLTSLKASMYMGGTTPVISRMQVRIRFNTAGAVTTSSPLQWTGIVSAAAAARSSADLSIDFPDGMEFLGDGTKQIGFTLTVPDWVTTTVIPVFYLAVTGFEY